MGCIAGPVRGGAVHATPLQRSTAQDAPQRATSARSAASQGAHRRDTKLEDALHDFAVSKAVLQLEEFARTFPTRFQLTRFGDVVKRFDVLHEPDGTRCTHQEDQYMVDASRAFDPDVLDCQSKHVVRLVLDQKVMRVRRLTPPLLRSLLASRLAKRAHVRVVRDERDRVDHTHTFLSHGGDGGHQSTSGHNR